MSDIHALSGAYAIDALDDIERAQFERHLAKCAECRAEVESLREASAMLAETTAVEPPPTCAGCSPTSRPCARCRRSRSPEVPAGEATGDAAADTAGATAGHTRWAHRWGHHWGHHWGPRRGRPREPDTAAGGNVRRCVPAVASSGVWWPRPPWSPCSVRPPQSQRPWTDDTSQAPRNLSAAERVQRAPDAVKVTQEIEGGGEAVWASKALNRVVVQTRDLPPLPGEGLRDVAAGQPRRHGPRGPDGLEDRTVVLEGDVASAVAAGITVEPAAGSTVPTSEPVALFPFENA